MADYLPTHKPGQAVTFTASADVTGGRLVAITGPYAVGPAPADSAAVIGVASRDAKAGERLTVFTTAGGVHGLPAIGAIAAGAKVSSATAGKIQTIGTTTNPIAIALQSAAAADDVIDVLFI